MVFRLLFFQIGLSVGADGGAYTSSCTNKDVISLNMKVPVAKDLCTNDTSPASDAGWWGAARDRHRRLMLPQA